MVDGVRVLNLYAGVGGNRKGWTGCSVVAVESDPKIAAVYARLHPDDEVVVGDAHQYLLDHSDDFDFIWSSPPCQSHSRMMKATRHRLRRYPDMGLYQEVIFLDHFFGPGGGRWVVENVQPYYEPLLPPTKRVGRHLFWTNFDFDADDVPRPSGFINQATVAGKQVLMDWLGIHYDENVYYEGNHCPVQVLRNCVHPDLGLQVYEQGVAA